MNKFTRKSVLFALAIIATGAVCFSFKNSDSHSFSISKNMSIFNAIVKELDMFYVDSIDPDVTIREGIDNMLYSLDPYTVYYPEDDQSELEQMVKGSFGGIGSIIMYNSKLKRSVISEPFEGTPAAKSGLKAGDVLLEINGEDLTGKDNQKVSEMLRGQVGTSLKVKVNRPGLDGKYTPMEFNLVRESIQTKSILYATVMEDSIGYINLNTFSGNPSKDFKVALLDLKKRGAKSLIIDIRDNGGGLLDEAVEIVNFFVPRGKTIVTTKGKIKQSCNTYKTLREPIDTDMPVAVLVNGNTASSSEILSGSLQDLDRAVIVGSRTFGKGLVQVPRNLPYGGSLKLTTSKYYIPSGRCVQAIDYAKRNDDGSVARIPDSLTTVFHTAAGREVRDGGGVNPDIEVTKEKLPNILLYLVRDNVIFDYATDYCIKHPTIASAEDFKLTDADYADFKKKVKAADFKYDQQSEKLLKALKEAAEFEGYLGDASDEFAKLEKKLQHNLDKDLDHFAKDIKSTIALEIVKRYYYQRGTVIEQLKEDRDLERAIAVLKSPSEYKKILSAQK
jgi:carboxyl-terminal processing protease